MHTAKDLGNRNRTQIRGTVVGTRGVFNYVSGKFSMLTLWKKKNQQMTFDMGRNAAAKFQSVVNDFLVSDPHAVQAY